MRPVPSRLEGLEAKGAARFGQGRGALEPEKQSIV